MGTPEGSRLQAGPLLRAVFPCSVPHTKSLESRIKEELIAQGLLESEERPAEDSEDEVLAELRKRQAELKALSAHNRTKKHDLLRWVWTGDMGEGVAREALAAADHLSEALWQASQTQQGL